ncbi:phage-like protein [Yersinia similis]|uniref:Phage-like protein n=1 Tax=Yersinia similis TaxID=367190 RepID=A0A0T9PS51_9GAMM|nr:phage-like protein [Yersinia similis]CNH79402.1 phage-like protein [Yersinia similis]
MTGQCKERPILFNSDMVKAILDGRKTQTRRIMKIQPSNDFYPLSCTGEIDFDARWYCPGVVDKDGYLQPAKKDVFGVANEEDGYICPLGADGDQLWVRETFGNCGVRIVYRADKDDGAHCQVKRWTPSLHMPREASRITLEITGVRVERLNTISTGDAMAEGYLAERSATGCHLDAWLWFRELWDGIYPDNTFEANPWVWVIDFKTIN